ncbi:MAG: hypothetical protein KA190_24925 [Kofleriaceae bacterium]|nr:hypothetical protein [Kofleriaceae bacterium]
MISVHPRVRHATLLLVLAATGCNGGAGAGRGGGGPVGSGGGDPASCDGLRERLTAQFAAYWKARDPERAELAVGDDVAMVLAECAQAPARVTACVRAAADADAVITTCLTPLGADGEEGDLLR